MLSILSSKSKSMLSLGKACFDAKMCNDHSFINNACNFKIRPLSMLKVQKTKKYQSLNMEYSKKSLISLLGKKELNADLTKYKDNEDIHELFELALHEKSSLSLAYLLNSISNKENTFILDENLSQSILYLIHDGSVQDSKYIRRSISNEYLQLPLGVDDINRLISCCVSKNQYSEAISWYDMLKVYKLAPNLDTFQLLLPAFSSKKQWTELFYILSEMKCYLLNSNVNNMSNGNSIISAEKNMSYHLTMLELYGNLIRKCLDYPQDRYMYVSGFISECQHFAKKVLELNRIGVDFSLESESSHDASVKKFNPAYIRNMTTDFACGLKCLYEVKDYSSVLSVWSDIVANLIPSYMSIDELISDDILRVVANSYCLIISKGNVTKPDVEASRGLLQLLSLVTDIPMDPVDISDENCAKSIQEQLAHICCRILASDFAFLPRHNNGEDGASLPLRSWNAPSIATLKCICWNYGLFNDISCLLFHHPDYPLLVAPDTTDAGTQSAVHHKLMSNLRPYDIIPVWDELTLSHPNANEPNPNIPATIADPVTSIIVLSDVLGYALATYREQTEYNDSISGTLYALATLCNHILSHNMHVISSTSHPGTVLLTESLVANMSLLFQIVENYEGVDLLLQNLFTNLEASNNSSMTDVTRVLISETVFNQLSQCLLKQPNNVSKVLLLYQKFSEQSTQYNAKAAHYVSMRDISSDDRGIQQVTLRKLIQNNKQHMVSKGDGSHGVGSDPAISLSPVNSALKTKPLKQPKAPKLKYSPYTLSTASSYIPLFKALIQLNELDLVLETLEDMVLVKGIQPSPYMISLILSALHAQNRDMELLATYKWAYGLNAPSNAESNSKMIETHNLYEQRNFIWNHTWFRQQSQHRARVGVGVCGDTGDAGDLEYNSYEPLGVNANGLTYNDASVILQSCLLLKLPYEAMCCYQLYMNKLESKIYTNANPNSKFQHYGAAMVVPIAKPIPFAVDTALECMRGYMKRNTDGNVDSSGRSKNKHLVPHTKQVRKSKHNKIEYSVQELSRVEQEHELCTYLLMTLVSKTSPTPLFDCSLHNLYGSRNGKGRSSLQNKPSLGSILLSLGIHQWKDDDLKTSVLEKMLGMALITATTSSTDEQSLGYAKSPSHRAQWFDQLLHRELFIGKLRVGINCLENSILFAVKELGGDFQVILNMLNGAMLQNHYYSEMQKNEQVKKGTKEDSKVQSQEKAKDKHACVLSKLIGEPDSEKQLIFKQRMEYLIRKL